MRDAGLPPELGSSKFYADCRRALRHANLVLAPSRLMVEQLAAIGLDTGHQPIHNEDETVWAVLTSLTPVQHEQQLRPLQRGWRNRFGSPHRDR